ncbi:MAG: Lrp/AsnC family transcriptional regulator [Planctomycetota bacterium]|nr:MAG: Lrp/AsnC family transcriptional regulator [Planctomycetota bacterium]
MKIDDKDVELLKATQDGLPIVREPYAAVGEKIGMSESEVIQRLRGMLDAGVVRRVGVTLAHRNAGFAANALIAWLVPKDRLDDAGNSLATRPEVTHCYARKPAPGWPYNLYTMIHGKSRAECDSLIREMSKEVNVGEFVVLYSARELKKTSFRIHS